MSIFLQFLFSCNFLLAFHFRGAVAVSMDIRMLDIDQCPDKYHVPNAYKDTHKCDDKSSYVRIDFLNDFLTAELMPNSFYLLLVVCANFGPRL